MPSALAQWSEFADALAVLDNGDDETLALVEEHFPESFHYERYAEPIWGAEAPARARLWEMALESGCEWILVLDADMCCARDPRVLLHSSHSSIAFNLYDLWGEEGVGERSCTTYRTDGYWKAHENWRCWMVENPGEHPHGSEGWKWDERGIHCGHFPWNLNLGRTLYAPSDYGLLHYAYKSKEDRERKYLMYAEQSDQLSEREIAHAESILDEDPTLKSLPFTPEYHLSK